MTKPAIDFFLCLIPFCIFYLIWSFVFSLILGPLSFSLVLSFTIFLFLFFILERKSWWWSKNKAINLPTDRAVSELQNALSIQGIAPESSLKFQEILHPIPFICNVTTKRNAPHFLASDSFFTTFTYEQRQDIYKSIQILNKLFMFRWSLSFHIFMLHKVLYTAQRILYWLIGKKLREPHWSYNIINFTSGFIHFFRPSKKSTNLEPLENSSSWELTHKYFSPSVFSMLPPHWGPQLLFTPLTPKNSYPYLYKLVPPKKFHTLTGTTSENIKWKTKQNFKPVSQL